MRCGVTGRDHDLKLRQLEDVVPNVSRETFERLLAYEALFFKWSKAINLAAPSTLGEFWSRHIVDSAQLASFARMDRAWLDLGSGGGLPGIVLAILTTPSYAQPIQLVESNSKKAAFLRAALNETGAKGIVHNCRIEDAVRFVGHAEFVSARALASLERLCALGEPWLSSGSIGVFHKGRDYLREIGEARGGWDFDLIEHPSVLSDDSVILEISNLKRRNNSV